MEPVIRDRNLQPVASQSFQLLGRKVSFAVSFSWCQLQQCCSFPSLSTELHGGWHWAGLTSAATSCRILCYLEIFYWYHLLWPCFASPSQLSFRCPICSNGSRPLKRPLLSIGLALAFVSLVYSELASWEKASTNSLLSLRNCWTQPTC